MQQKPCSYGGGLRPQTTSLTRDCSVPGPHWGHSPQIPTYSPHWLLLPTPNLACLVESLSVGLLK